MDIHGEGALGSRILYRLGYLYMDQDRYDEAEDVFTKGIEYGNREFPGKNHPRTLFYKNGLAVLCTKTKRYSEAKDLFEEVLEIRQHKLGDDHPHTLDTKNDLAVLYKEQGEYDKADLLFLEVIKNRRLRLGDTHPHTIESLKNLIALYEAWNKSDQANQWRTKLPKDSR
jgi:tetratricopeptide (TPR) repeat protein